MVNTLEVKRKYTCDLCHDTIVSHAMPVGWIRIDGFEPDDRLPSPTIDLCAACAIRAYRKLTNDVVISKLFDYMKNEGLVNTITAANNLNKLYAAGQLEKPTDIDSLWCTPYGETYCHMFEGDD